MISYIAKLQEQFFLKRKCQIKEGNAGTTLGE